MKMKVFLGVLFIFILSQFNDIRANDIDQAKPTVLRKYNGEFFSETSPNRYERHQPRRERSCSSCGIVNRKKEIRTAIIRGDDVTPPYKYPWMELAKYPILTCSEQVALYTKGNKTCTGAIISEYYILTAAHCLVKDDHKHKAFEPSKAKLEFFSPEDMGVAFLTSTYKIKAGPHVQEVIPHKLFTMSKMSYDIGLLKLKKKIVCDTFKLPICLPPPRLSLPQNAVETISGWGSTTGRVEDVNYVLQEATVKEEKFEECRGPDYMKGKYYCLKGLKNQAACYGDSGGPAFYKNNGRVYVIGVASFGQCLPGRPFFYTSVSAHLEWIHENIGSSSAKHMG